MSICHSFWESKLLKDVTRSLSLHSDCVGALNWVALLSLLIKSDFVHNSVSKLLKYLLDTFSDVLSTLLRDLLNLLRGLSSSLLLKLREVINSVSVGGQVAVNELELLHANHVFSVFGQVSAVVVLEHKEFVSQGVLGLHSVVVLDGFLPHSHELPLLELLEERQVLDVVVGVSLDEPLAEGKEFNWSIVFVKGKTFS